MPDVEFKWHRNGAPIPEGWYWDDALEGTHHGANGFGMIVKTGPASDALSSSPSQSLCQCGKPLVTEDRGHHVVCQCGQVLEGCCGDV